MKIVVIGGTGLIGSKAVPARTATRSSPPRPIPASTPSPARASRGLYQRLLGPGTLCQGDGGYEWGDRPPEGVDVDYAPDSRHSSGNRTVSDSTTWRWH